MSVTVLTFFLFATLATIAAVMVIIARNMVHAAMFLIMVFINTAAIYILNGAEFLGLLLIVVYVGAVAVLFLFVIMMLNLNAERAAPSGKLYLLSGLCLLAVLFVEFGFVVVNWESVRVPTALDSRDIGGIQAIAAVLYTDYFFVFQLVGAILLVAMVAAIALTLRKSQTVLKQAVSEQQRISAADRLRTVDIAPAGKRLLGRTYTLLQNQAQQEVASDAPSKETP